MHERKTYEEAYVRLLWDMHLAYHVGVAAASALKHHKGRENIRADAFMTQHVVDAMSQTRAFSDDEKNTLCDDLGLEPHLVYTANRQADNNARHALEKRLAMGPQYDATVSAVTSDLFLSTSEDDTPYDTPYDMTSIACQKDLVEAMVLVRSEHMVAVQDALARGDEKRLGSLHKAEERFHADPLSILLVMVSNSSKMSTCSRKRYVTQEDESDSEEPSQEKEIVHEEDRNKADITASKKTSSILEKIIAYIMDQELSEMLKNHPHHAKRKVVRR